MRDLIEFYSLCANIRSYKAVLTPMNVTWTVNQLYTELAKEHAVMSAKDKATTV